MKKSTSSKGDKEHFDVIIVGAGISGATLAECYARVKKARVLVIEARDHIGGNCYDYLDKSGILVAKYGPHYFHTNDEGVWKYVSRFTEWHPYEHRVLSHVDGKKVPVPVNITTVNRLFGLDMKTGAEMEAWLEANREKVAEPLHSEHSALARVGRILYEKMFKGYTQKQWDKHPSELDKSVMDRIPVRTDFDDRYFTDTHQAMPKDGYARIFEKMLADPLIEVRLNTGWEDIKDSIVWDKLFFTGRIDEYFKEKLGKLEYRSLRFEHETIEKESFQDAAQENYPSGETAFTRIVEYKKATGQRHPHTAISREYPTWDGEPYYPVPSPRNHELYKEYQKAAAAEEKQGIYFVGRLANYKYFNMDQAFRNALDLFERIEGPSEDKI